MVISVSKQPIKLREMMRKAGYRFEKRSQAHETSFYRTLFPGRKFPRFHIYVDDKKDRWVIKLHLDQKPHTYEGKSAHAGEYDGDAVEKEMERIKEIFSRVEKLEKEKAEKRRIKNLRRKKLRKVALLALVVVFVIVLIYWML